MSSREFKEALEALRIPNYQVGEAGDYEWLFDNEKAVPFLAWFCDQVKFARDAALVARQPQQQGLSEPEDDSLVECGQDVETLVRLRDKCNIHQVELSGKKPYIKHVKENAQAELMRKQEVVKAVNEEMNQSCNKLVTSVHNLCVLYQLIDNDGKVTGSFGDIGKPKQDKVRFLSALDSSEYFILEEKFTGQLSEYTKREFFDGVADLTGQNNSEEFQLLDLAQVTRSASRCEEYEELEQANQIFPRGESRRVQAVVENAAVQAALAHARTFSYPATGGEDVTRKLQALLRHEQGKQEILQHDLLKLQEEEVPVLVKYCAEAMMAEFLQGDYDLKIKRQDFFHAKQNRVIEELLQQRARSELMTMCLAAEHKQHNLNRKLVVAVCLFLQSLLDVHKNLDAAAAAYQQQTAQKYSKSTIDSRKKDLVELHELLSNGRDGGDQKLFLTHEQLSEYAKEISSQLNHCRTKAARSRLATQESLHSYIKCINQMESVLFPRDCKPGRLSLPQVTEAASSLCEILDQLEKPALQLIKSVTTQSDALSGDQLTQIGRDLFVAFYNDPDKLRRTFDLLK